MQKNIVIIMIIITYSLFFPILEYSSFFFC